MTNWILSSVAMMRCSMSFQARIIDKYIYFALFLLIFSLSSLWLTQSNPSKVKIQSYCHTPKITIRFLISRKRFHPIQNTTQFRWPCWDAIQADHGYCMQRRANSTKRKKEICKMSLSCTMKTGADLGGRFRGCAIPPPEMTCGFLIQLVFCKKKNYVVYCCWSRARDECTPS